MQLKWLMLFIFVYIVGMFLGSTFEMHTEAAGTWFGSGSAGLTESPQTTLSYIFNLRNIVQMQPQLGGAISLPSFNEQWFDSFFKIITWRFDFLYFDDFGRFFYWIVVFPFAGAGIASVGILIYGIITGNLVW